MYMKTDNELERQRQRKRAYANERMSKAISRMYIYGRNDNDLRWMHAWKRTAHLATNPHVTQPTPRR